MPDDFDRNNPLAAPLEAYERPKHWWQDDAVWEHEVEAAVVAVLSAIDSELACRWPRHKTQDKDDKDTYRQFRREVIARL